MKDASHSSEFAQKRLAQACRTKDTSVRLAWAITLGEAVLLGILAVALIDYWLMLPVWTRSTGAAVLGLLTLFGIYRLWRVYRRPTQLKEAALDLEAQQPNLGCEISTAAEYLSGERKSTQDYEPQLVAALEAKAAEELRASQIHYERGIIRPAVVLFLTLLALLIFVVVAPVAFTALTRAAFPFSNAHYTRVQVLPGNVEIPVGQSVQITNLFSGRAPKNPQLSYKQPGAGAWQTVPLTIRGADGAYLYPFKELRDPLIYRVSGNDAVSEDYEIQTYFPPEVKELSVRINYPSYTGLPPSEQKTADITAVRASTVQIQVEPSVKLSNAKLRFSNSVELLELHPDATGNWTGTLAVTKDADYWIELADLKGHRGGDENSHHIKAVPDAPPRVEVENPGQDTHASATNKLPVKISVADDFGVDQIKLVFHKLGGAEQVVTAERNTNEKGEIIATAELDLSALELKDYELVAYHAEAKDNNTLDGPGVGKSPVYFVEITNLEGGICKKPKPGQKMNLLVLQKQIIADTTALAADVSSNVFGELAARQNDVKDFGQIYLNTLNGNGAPAGAVSEMRSAVEDMNTAKGQLAQQRREGALPPEESALAHLYQVLKQLPELQDLPTQPKPDQQPPPTNQLAIVLDAIKETKKEQADDKPVETALQQAQNLAEAQAALNSAMRHPGSGSAKGQGQGEPKSPGAPKTKNEDAEQAKDKSANSEQAKAQSGPKTDQLAKAELNDEKQQGQGQGQGKGKGKGKGKGQGQGQAKSKGQGQGQGQGQGKGKGKGEGQGQGQGDGKGQGQGEGKGEQAADQDSAEPMSADQSQPPDPSQLAQQEQQLSKEAQQLADQLERLAGKDKRLGHNAGQNAKLGGQKIATASDEIKKGNFGSAGVNGFQGELALRQVVTQLERILKNQPDLTDVANEDAPREYEGLISEYFKKLSHAE